VARETQERFLPSKLPSIDGIDIWGANLSSLEVSGDYYDVLDLGEGRPLVIGIADVSGKGLPAAMVMSNVQAGLHTLLLQEKFAVGPAMTTLNQVVCGNVSAGRFVTMFLAEMDKNGRAMRYVLAGHDPPLQITRAGGVRKLEEAGTFFLGLSSNTSYKPGNAVLSAGDVVCLYTDGITEAMDQDEAFFGEDRLQSVLLDSREKGAQEIGAAVLGAVKEHSRGTQQADDITLVVIKVTEKEESPWSSARP
jgi:sigma-B regulation protein RsbU (phosphoserine phosphatase)